MNNIALHKSSNMHKLLYPSFVWLIQLTTACIATVMFMKIIHPAQPGHFGSFYSWDGGWYLAIAKNGYLSTQKAAFFPLYPLLIRIVHEITSLSYRHSSLVVSNISLWLALIFLYQLVLDTSDKLIAKRTLWLLTLFPTALFFNCAYTESVNLLALVLFFYFLQKDHWYLAMISGFFATVAHDLGVLLVFPGLVVLWKNRHAYTTSTTIIRFFSLAIIPASLVLFMLYLQHHFGNPLQFLDAANTGWDKKIVIPIYFVFKNLIYLYQHPNLPNAPIMVIHGILTLMMVAIGVLMITFNRKHISLEMKVFFWVTLIASITPSNNLSLESYGRYMAVLFPGFIVWAYYCRREWVFLNSICLMLPVKTILIGMFANWYGIN